MLTLINSKDMNLKEYKEIVYNIIGAAMEVHK